MDIRSPDFGKAIKEKLYNLDVTQTAVAKRLNISNSYLGDILANKKKAFCMRKRIVSVIKEIELETESFEEVI